MASARVQAPDAQLRLPDAAREELGDRVRDDAETLRTFASDWWPLAKVWQAHGDVAAFPAAVVTPRDANDVAEILHICARRGVPVTPAAGRSGVCGQAVPVQGGVVLDLLPLDAVLELDEESLTVTVEPGILGSALEEQLRARGYTLGHRPQSIALSTVGGWIACRSAGQYSTRYGTIADLVLALEVAAPAGTLSVRRGVGPDLLQLFVGSEGTLGVVTRATLAVRPLPPA